MKRRRTQMLDRTIPFYNVILRCDNPNVNSAILPTGYRFRMYQSGDEDSWARLEYEIGDFDTVNDAKQYFVSTYIQNDSLDIFERCVFVVNPENEIVGSCIAWQDLKNDICVGSLHWLIVSPKYQDMGLGKALCRKVMQIFSDNQENTIYIHTQPWSYKAIILYIRQGFKIQMSDSFSHYENQFDLAMNTLKEILCKEQYDEILNYINE